MSKASAKAWTPRRALPFTVCLYETRASAIATSTAPAPGTTQPVSENKEESYKHMSHVAKKINKIKATS